MVSEVMVGVSYPYECWCAIDVLPNGAAVMMTIDSDERGPVHVFAVSTVDALLDAYVSEECVLA